MSGKFLVVLAVAAFIRATQAMPAELVAVMLENQEKCIAMAGSDEGYQQMLGSIQMARTCVLNQLDVQQLQIDAMQLAQGSRKPFFDKYCPKFNESVSCFDDTFEGIAKCSGDDVDKVKALLKSMTHGLLDLACQNDGQLFFDARKPGFKDCMIQLKEHGAQECKLSNSTTETLISRYGEHQCRELDDTKECLKRKIDECDAPRIFDIVQVVFNAISKANDCKQYTTLGEIPSNNIDGTVSEN
ncbi:27 kDa glycoprotein-like [Ochlerotatus camptorhynchus]|uniref:27 kDa glycoprotein-like n=1 Tax=Ochlerotatus camptorhynchus TaxID=644619 RepID=UPI0031D8CF01